MNADALGQHHIELQPMNASAQPAATTSSLAITDATITNISVKIIDPTASIADTSTPHIEEPVANITSLVATIITKAATTIAATPSEEEVKSNAGEDFHPAREADGKRSASVFYTTASSSDADVPLTESSPLLNSESSENVDEFLVHYGSDDAESSEVVNSESSETIDDFPVHFGSNDVVGPEEATPAPFPDISSASSSLSDHSVVSSSTPPPFDRSDSGLPDEADYDAPGSSEIERDSLSEDPSRRLIRSDSEEALDMDRPPPAPGPKAPIAIEDLQARLSEDLDAKKAQTSATQKNTSHWKQYVLYAVAAVVCAVAIALLATATAVSFGGALIGISLMVGGTSWAYNVLRNDMEKKGLENLQKQYDTLAAATQNVDYIEGIRKILTDFEKDSSEVLTENEEIQIELFSDYELFKLWKKNVPAAKKRQDIEDHLAAHGLRLKPEIATQRRNAARAREAEKKAKIEAERKGLEEAKAAEAKRKADELARLKAEADGKAAAAAAAAAAASSKPASSGVASATPLASASTSTSPSGTVSSAGTPLSKPVSRPDATSSASALGIGALPEPDSGVGLGRSSRPSRRSVAGSPAAPKRNTRSASTPPKTQPLIDETLEEIDDFFGKKDPLEDM